MWSIWLPNFFFSDLIWIYLTCKASRAKTCPISNSLPCWARKPSQGHKQEVPFVGAVTYPVNYDNWRNMDQRLSDSVKQNSHSSPVERNNKI